MHDCVGGLLVRRGRVLLGLRAFDAAWLAGRWDVFGGHVEPGEDAGRALWRELDEELGVQAEALYPLGELEGAAPDPWRLRLFAVTAWAGQVWNRQPHAHLALRWCTRDEACERLEAAHPGFPALVDRALERA